eukprot:gene8005-13914_t
MANVDEEIKKIQIKFKVLKFNREEATKLPEKKLTKTLTRYIRGFNQQIEDVHTLKVAVQELKIEADETLQKIVSGAKRPKRNWQNMRAFWRSLKQTGRSCKEREWGFTQLVETLRKWCERNPFHSDERRERVFQTDDKTGRSRGCVYCHEPGHKSAECDKIKSLAEGRRLLSDKKLCFNCTGGKHRAAECRSKIRCQRCTGKHHTSICDQEQQQVLIANEQYHANEAVTYPVVVASENGVKCRALLDTGAGSSYASKTLLDLIKIKPVRKKTRRIDMMMQSVNQRIEVYNVNIASIDEKFSLQAFVSKVDKDVLLALPNPKYDSMISRFHISLTFDKINMNDKEKKPCLPTHFILDNSEY